MAKQVLLPELAESVVEGEIVKWLVEEGQTVELEQPLCEVMTDKVTVELPSPFAGVLSKKLAAEGDVVPVHAPIAEIEEGGAAGAAASQGGEQPSAQQPSAQDGNVRVDAAAGEQAAMQAIQDSAENPGTRDLDLPTTAGETLPPTAQEERSIVEAGHIARDSDDTSLFKTFGEAEAIRVPALGGQKGDGPAPRADGRVLAVPAARQLARDLGIDIAQVRGSGPGGRVRVLDVHGHAAAQAQPQTAQAPASQGGGMTGGGMTVPPVQYKTPKGYEHLETRTPLRGMRRAISNQMVASHLYTVRTLTVDEINMTRLVELRGRTKADAERAGVKVSYLPFIFKAIAAALKKYPSLNTSFDEASGEIVSKDYYNIGMAVATDAGLTVPVIRDVDRKSIYTLASEVNDIAGRARDGGLKPEEMAGSTFSVTNIGTIGALFSFPIINVPDAAILGIHSIQKRPIVGENDEIVVAHMMYISLSFDHRLVDGAEAARFCREVIRLLENPDRLMMEGM